ncbi:hypothetical protein Trydic_g10279 [Trypoxylus dichotomus]
MTENTAESLKKHLVEKQTAKFQRIDNAKQYKLDPSRMVVNLTNKTLPPEAISILEKGSNFAVTPKSVPKEEIIANVETAIRRLPATEGDAVRTDVARILRTAKPQKSHISRAEPIVSAIGAPTYLLTKQTTLLQPYISGKPSYIRDSAHFVEKLREIRFNPGDILVNFDVVSLFTKVLLVDTLRYIADLFPPDITNLFKHCLRTSYFVWDGSFYEETDGVAMAGPLSPVVANLFMEQFESLAIETAVNKPTV